jgi:hypothetical protein
MLLAIATISSGRPKPAREEIIFHILVTPS